MPLITLNFTGTVQSSVQINDIAYYVSTSSLGGFNTGSSDNLVKIGPITSVGTTSIVCDMDSSVVPPSANHFIMFSKDNAANMSSILGYYAKVQLKNNSTTDSELFSLESDFFESSK
tara:strand:- start:645 stop:995 length:351 start_codon:yes stop_codon:yes gene_type:complete